MTRARPIRPSGRARAQTPSLGSLRAWPRPQRQERLALDLAMDRNLCLRPVDQPWVPVPMLLALEWVQRQDQVPVEYPLVPWDRTYRRPQWNQTLCNNKVRYLCSPPNLPTKQPTQYCQDSINLLLRFIWSSQDPRKYYRYVVYVLSVTKTNVDGLVQDCSNSGVLTMKFLFKF